MAKNKRLAAALLALAPLAGGGADPAPFGFLEPEVIRASWQLRSLTLCDINQDGKNDFAVLNNEKARVDLYLQREPGFALKDRPKPQAGRWDPVLENSRFQLESITTGRVMLDLAVGDLNGDGKTDLACTTRDRGLLVFFQREGGRWSDPVSADLDKPSTSGDSLLIQDLDGDKKPELIALTEAHIVMFRVDAAGKVQQSSKLALASEGSMGLQILDLNGDGRSDLMLLAPSSPQYALRVRLQAADGSFGPEMVVRYDVPSGYINELRRDAAGAPVFTTVQNRSGEIEIFSLRPGIGQESLMPHAVEAYSVPAKGSSRTLQYARGDFNGDGREDLAAVDFAGAQVFLFLQGENGQLGAPRPFPSLASINSIAAADLTGDGQAEILVTSSVEEAAGIATFKDGRLSYPDLLTVKGKPLAVAAGDLNGDGLAEVVLATRDEERRVVQIWNGRKGELPVGQPAATNLTLTALTEDPVALRIHDVNQDGSADLLFLATSKPLHAALQTGPMAFEEVKDLNGYSRGLVSRVDPRTFALADVNADGKPEMILATKGFVRAIRLMAERQYEVVDQYNATSPETEISAALFVPMPGQVRPLLLLADAAAKRMEIMRPVENNGYESAELVDLPDTQINGAWVVPGKESPALFLVGKSGFWRFAVNSRSGLQVKRQVTHQTDIPDLVYAGVDAEDMNGDGRKDLIGFDSTVTRIIEFLTVDDDWSITSRMHFRLFESEGPQRGDPRGGSDPKEGLLKDFTGDGKNDMLLYMHDRILLYPQE